MVQIDEQAATLAAEEAEVKTFAAEVAALKDQIESQAVRSAGPAPGTAKPPSSRPRTSSPRTTASATAGPSSSTAPTPWRPSSSGACSGCYVSVTAQTMNELINAQHLSFCKTCGRILYLAEEDVPTTRRSAVTNR